ncbi:hypothetical protein DL93DRAFT_2088779 [Clavulina sp. PMI_390]|nr:hypothetical protein DL93DRAFT_2088779 [Clavulina sp. PMI_390]
MDDYLRRQLRPGSGGQLGHNTTRCGMGELCLLMTAVTITLGVSECVNMGATHMKFSAWPVNVALRNQESHEI